MTSYSGGMLVNIYQFLDHSEQQKTYLLRFLEQHHAEYLPSQKIMDFLSISNFKLQKLIDEINEDFQEHRETAKLQIKIENKHFIYCPDLTEKDISYLKLTYLEKSYLFLLLQELMIQPTSIYTFADNFYISKTKAYNVQKELIQILASFNLTIKGGILIGDEITIRNLLYNIYYNFYHGIKEPLSERMDDASKQFFLNLTAELSSNLPVTQRLKLFFFLFVNFFRIKAKAPLVEFIFSKEPTVSETTHDETISKFFNLFDLAEEIRFHEMNYVKLFFYAEKMTDVLPPELSHVNLKNVTKNTKQLMNRFNSFFNDKYQVQLEDHYFVKTEMEIYRINLKWEFFPTPVNSFISENQLTYFSEVYPEYYQFLTEYFEKHITSMDLINRIALMYDYLFAFITFFPIGEISSKIYICIDFSRGVNYSEYIKNNVLRFKSMNIIVQHTLTEDTQLFISDFLMPNLQCETVVWKEPPSHADWQLLGDLLVKIRRSSEVK